MVGASIGALASEPQSPPDASEFWGITDVRRKPRRSSGTGRSSDRRLGGMQKLLRETREHAGEVQLAMQAWEVWCISRVMYAFCYSLLGEVDEALRLVFERMQLEGELLVPVWAHIY